MKKRQLFIPNFVIINQAEANYKSKYSTKMTIKNVFSFLLAIAFLGFTACSEDEEPTPTPTTQNISLNISGLQDLGSDFVYEGWIIVDGAPVSTGTFTVDDAGTLSKTDFSVNISDAENAVKFVLSIEPAIDSDPAPSNNKILAGDFSGATSTLSVSDGAALGTNFEAATGKYILATPTDGGMDTDENSGVWFLEITANGPAAGLDLPALPEGWAYEGWAVVDGTPVSTGTFVSATGADAAAAYSGSSDGPPFPGEDLLNNAPSGLSFPVDLAGKTVVISVEPVPDNSPAPFVLKPLVGMVAADAIDHTTYDMANNAVATNPTGTVTK